MGALNQLVPGMREAAGYLVEAVRLAGGTATVTSVLRTRKRQEQLYRRWLEGRSPFPAAKPGTSKHEKGLAFDVVIRPKALETAAGHLWESWGGRWGGRFKDPIHFEAP